jgi:hypothetical protein
MKSGSKDGNRANIRCIRELDFESRVFLNSKFPSKPSLDREARKYDYVIDYDYNTASFSEQVNTFAKNLKSKSKATSKFNCLFHDTCCSKHSLVEITDDRDKYASFSAISDRKKKNRQTRANTISNSSYMNESSFSRVSSRNLLVSIFTKTKTLTIHYYYYCYYYSCLSFFKNT